MISGDVSHGSLEVYLDITALLQSAFNRFFMFGLALSGLVQDSDLTAKQRDCSETLVSSSMALFEMINVILDFTKTRAGKITLRPAPTESDALLGDVVALLAPVAEARGSRS
ncbi:MAG: hypothetical protein HRU31_06890 [Rhodobacteraceae bacterium]|nr:hypothetical protein [Paracoccaceae bacterium]